MMFDKETTEKILQSIIWLNEKMGVWSFVVPAVFAVAVIYFLLRAYQNPSTKNTKLLLSVYTIIYLFSGWTIYMGRDLVGSNVAIAGAVGLWSVSVLLIIDMIFGWTEIRLTTNKYLRSISLFLFFGGIFLYPILEIIFGFTYPRMVFFSAECPTTISLIGVFIGSIPKVNKPLFVIISLNAIFTGISIALSGATFDYFYALAGVLGALVILIHFKSIFWQNRGVEV